MTIRIKQRKAIFFTVVHLAGSMKVSIHPLNERDPAKKLWAKCLFFTSELIVCHCAGATRVFHVNEIVIEQPKAISGYCVEADDSQCFSEVQDA